MKPASGCRLFGAYQALMGIKDVSVLIHSVVGCGFGTMSFHVPSQMNDIRQSCTVISDSDVVYGGEEFLNRAIISSLKQYDSNALFVISGCVSEIIGTDVRAAVEKYSDNHSIYYIESAGFRGDSEQGYELALASLAELMQPAAERDTENPVVNILGFGADDFRCRQDVDELRRLIEPQVTLGAAVSACSLKEIKTASSASLNIVVGRGLALAQKMEQMFGIPYRIIDYPYGLTGTAELFSCLEEFFSVDYSCTLKTQKTDVIRRFETVYPYLQAFYQVPAALIGTGGRANGLRKFLSEELGFEVRCFAQREKISDIEDFFNEVRDSECALLFGSSFEQELADDMKIPLLRYDYPVFDRVCLTDSPYAGAAGALCLTEDLLNEIMTSRPGKGALYQ